MTQMDQTGVKLMECMQFLGKPSMNRHQQFSGKGEMCRKRKLSDNDDDAQSKTTKTDSSNTEDNILSTPTTPFGIKTTTSNCFDSGYESRSTTQATPQPASNSSSLTDDCVTLLPEHHQKKTVKKRILFKFGRDHLLKYLQKHFVRFKDEVDPKEIANQLFSTKVISSRDLENIIETPGRRKKVDIMLKAIAHSKIIKDVNTTTKVLEAFASNGRADLFNGFDDDIDDELDLCSTDNVTMEQVEFIMKKHETQLIDEIDPLAIIDELLERRVLTFDEHQNIVDIDFKLTKMICLCRYILNKPVFAFREFVQVLQRNASYKYIGDILVNENNTTGASSPQVQLDLQLDYQFVCAVQNNSRDNIGTEIKFDLGCKEIEKMIVDHNEETATNDELQHEAMDLGFEVEYISFSSIKIRLNCLTAMSQMNLLNKSKESLLYIEKILKTLITQKHLALMKEKNLNALHVAIHIQLPEAEMVTCLCILRKEDIVNHFTLIEQSLKGASTFVDALKNSQLWEEEKQEEWSVARKDVYALLRLILDGDDRLLCMLEKHLRTTDQIKLLSIIITKNDAPEYLMSLRDINQKRELIADEIEPRKFIDMLRRIEGGEAILEMIMSIQIPRRKRCEEFINFVLKKKANRQFQDELKRQKMDDVITMISRRKITCKSLTSRHYRDALVATMGSIAENIEPFRFKKFLVSPPEIREDDFQKICSITTRKARVYALMKKIIRGSDMLIERFMDGLDALEYHGLLQLIEENAEKNTHCPRLMRRLEGHVFAVGGIFHINYKTCDCEPESHLQVYLNLQNKLPLPNNDTEFVDDQQTGDPLKEARISEWIMSQPQNAYVDCFEENLQGSVSVGESCTSCLHKTEEVPSLSHKISDDTLTVSSVAPTTSWSPFPSESPLQSGSPFQSESLFHSERQCHLQSPFQSDYDDVTSPSLPAWQPLIPHRPIKRKWNHSVSDGYTSSMSSPSSSLCSPSAVALNSPIDCNRIHSIGERKFPINTLPRRGSTGFSPKPFFVTKSKDDKGYEEYKWKCDEK